MEDAESEMNIGFTEKGLRVELKALRKRAPYEELTKLNLRNPI